MNYSFNNSEQTKGFGLCVERVNELLNDAKILLENGGNVHTVMGLYTFAVGGSAGDTITRTGTVSGFLTLQTTSDATASCTQV